MNSTEGAKTILAKTAEHVRPLIHRNQPVSSGPRRHLLPTYRDKARCVIYPSGSVRFRLANRR